GLAPQTAHTEHALGGGSDLLLSLRRSNDFHAVGSFPERLRLVQGNDRMDEGHGGFGREPSGRIRRRLVYVLGGPAAGATRERARASCVLRSVHPGCGTDRRRPVALVG